MAKYSDNTKSEQPDIGLPSTSVPSGPVECLGMAFPSDDERRKYFLEKLAEKLKDPEFRKIEGFPIGEDEDILALSDPPYYTACPNPWLADFIRQYGTRYNPKKKYHREPFAADVSEGKNDPIYNAHSYHTKVPHKAIMRYILHYTEPGDVVFDGFCGTGMTGVAAQMCGNRVVVESLGYRVENDDVISQKKTDENGKTFWKAFSKLGARLAALNDLSPAATFIASNYNTPVDVNAFEHESKRILKKVEDEYGWMYETLHTDSKTKGRINYTVWSDVFICPDCADDIIFWESAVDKDTWQVNDDFCCGSCGARVGKRGLERAYISYLDERTGKVSKSAKQVPTLIHYKIAGSTYTKMPDKNDLDILEKINKTGTKYWYPQDLLPDGDKMSDPKGVGINVASDFYSKRALYNLSMYCALARQSKLDGRLLVNLTSSAVVLSRQYRFRSQGGSLGAGGGPMNGTLYVPSLIKEIPVTKVLRQHIERMANIFLMLSNSGNIIQTGSLSCLPSLESNSIDYMFIDPPFGSNIMYSELNFLWEAWLRVKTNNKEEAIENRTQKKGIDEYRLLMAKCFAETYRVLKPGRWMTVEFSNTKAAVWNSILTALAEAGFIVANVSFLDKKQGSFNAVNNPVSVKQDLVISAYKPNGGLEDRFAKSAETEAGVWDFIRTHLGNLPVTKLKGGQLEPIAERDSRILFDRTVAFYIRHGIPVPISSPEFQAGLAEKFPERDGMYFLSEQAMEYDKVRMKMEGIGQLTLFVEDERSAVAWLRNYLKNKPCKYNDIMPEFFEQLNQSWKKWETRPELRSLLDQYFLCYSGEGDIPPQIHSYLSTNFKELRNLPADHAMLRAKARDRWFVPDPRKNADVEQLREKRLLEEFWAYMPPGYESAARRKKMQTAALPGMEQMASKIVKGKRIAIVRTEAVRVGFNFCFSQNDYQTIIAVARHIPEDVIQNDEQLQMIYDSAVTRTADELE